MRCSDRCGGDVMRYLLLRPARVRLPEAHVRLLGRDRHAAHHSPPSASSPESATSAMDFNNENGTSFPMNPPRTMRGFGFLLVVGVCAVAWILS